MGFDAIKGFMTDDLAYDVLAEIQEKLSKGIYYLEEMYYEGTEEGEKEVIEGIGKNDLDVERHLKPLKSTPDVEVSTFEGKVNITVSVINMKGERKELLIPMKVEYENDEENIDFGEYFGEFVEESNHWIKEEMKGAWLESDDGDFITHTEVTKNIGDTQVIILDRDVFVEAVENKYGNGFVRFDHLKGRGLQDLMEDVVGKLAKRGTKSFVLKDFSIGLIGSNNFGWDANFITLRTMYEIKEGRKNISAKSERIIYIEGDTYANVVKSIANHFEELNKELKKSDLVAVEVPVKEGKSSIELQSMKDEETFRNILRSQEGEKKQLVLFSGGSYRIYVHKMNTDEKIYVVKQNVKYKTDERYEGITQRFQQAVSKSKELKGCYNDKENYFVCKEGGLELIVGPHYALLKNKEGLKVLYNLKESNVSIQKVRQKIGKGNKLGVFLNVILDIVDGRKGLTQEKIERSLGG